MIDMIHKYLKYYSATWSRWMFIRSYDERNGPPEATTPTDAV